MTKDLKDSNDSSNHKKGKMVDKKDFATSIKLFYSKFLNSIADNIDALAIIEEEFKEDYENLKEIQKDPALILEKLRDLDEKEKDELIGMFMRIAQFEGKILKLFDLSPEEKKQLAKDLKEFTENIIKWW